MSLNNTDLDNSIAIHGPKRLVSGWTALLVIVISGLAYGAQQYNAQNAMMTRYSAYSYSTHMLP